MKYLIPYGAAKIKKETTDNINPARIESPPKSILRNEGKIDIK